MTAPERLATAVADPVFVARFWAKVDKRGPDECWPWTGGVDRGGYGQLRVRPGIVRAHRFSRSLHHGPIPLGLEVRHRCDNPPCVNPVHLDIGTRQQNADDMRLRGRANWGCSPRPGELSPTAKLTAVQVAQIRRLWSDGERVTDLALAYGMSKASISMIVNGKRWRAA